MTYIYKNSKGKVRLSKTKPRNCPTWIKITEDGSQVWFFIKGKVIIRDYQRESRFKNIPKWLWCSLVATQAFMLYENSLVTTLKQKLAEKCREYDTFLKNLEKEKKEKR